MSDITVNVTDQIVEVDVTDQIIEVEVSNAAGPAGPGVAVGGTVGQLLIKNSSTNYDTGWSNRNATLGEFGLSLGNAIFDTTPTNIPTQQGSVYWDDAAETLALVMNGTIQKVGEDVFFHVKNQSGSSIPKGTAVMFAGTDGNSGKMLIEPFLADGTYPSQYFMGITSEVIANGANGKVFHFGKMRGINTSAFQDGDLLYASTTVAGGFQTTVPTAPNNIVLIAAVINAANNGTIMIRPTYGSNINNDEGVLITNPTNGQVLKYNSTSGLWENGTDASSNIYNSDGTLTGNRVVTMGANTLSFEKDLLVHGLTVGRGPLAGTSTNTALGISALALQTSGAFNVAVGYEALKKIDSSQNIAIGALAMTNSTSASDNVAIGHNVLRENITGDRNVGIGYNVLSSGVSTNMQRNTAVGYLSMSSAGGNDNTAFGAYTLQSVTGSFNTAVGNLITGLTTGSYNTVVGSQVVLDASASNNIILADGLGNIKYRWDGLTNNLYGTATISTINAATTDTDKFLVSDSGVVKFRTGAEVLSDIGGQAALTNPVTGTGTAGQVSYWSGTNTQTGSNNLFWDDANGRLGVGTNAPDFTIKSQKSVPAGYDGIVHKNTSSTGIAAISIQGSAASNNDLSIFVGSPSQTIRTTFGLTGNYADLIANTANGFSMGTFTSTPFIIGTNSTARFQVFGSTGNVLIQNGGTFTDSGQRLQVQGTTLLNGSIRIGNASLNQIFPTTDGTTVNTGAQTIAIVGGTGGYPSIFLGRASAVTNTFAGTQELVRVIGNFTPTSGGHIFEQLRLQSTINQTGGANGITRGLYVNPTLTAAADWRSIEWSNNSGWGLYGAGTSNNYLNGDTTIGTTTLGTATKLTIGGSETASSAIARGTLINTTLTAAANNDVLVGLDVAPTFTNGAFTGVQNLAIRTTGNASFGGLTIAPNSIAAANTYGRLWVESDTTAVPDYTLVLNNRNTSGTTGTTTGIYFANGGGGASQPYNNQHIIGSIRYYATNWNNVTSRGYMSFFLNDSTSTQIEYFRLNNNGNIIIQNGGSFTDAGFRLDVNGTARVQGALTVSTGGVNVTGTGAFSDSLTITKNAAATTQINLINTTANAASQPQIKITSDSGTFWIAKRSSLNANYKTLQARDSYIYNDTDGNIGILNDVAAGKITFAAGGSSTVQWQIESTGQLTASDAINIAVGTTTGTKIGTATSQKLSLWNATPIVQPTTGIAEAAFVENSGGTAVNVDSTFDGYTMQQVVKALRDMGALA